VEVTARPAKGYVLPGQAIETEDYQRQRRITSLSRARMVDSNVDRETSSRQKAMASALVLCFLSKREYEVFEAYMAKKVGVPPRIAASLPSASDLEPSKEYYSYISACMISIAKWSK